MLKGFHKDAEAKQIDADIRCVVIQLAGIDTDQRLMFARGLLLSEVELRKGQRVDDHSRCFPSSGRYF